MIVALVRFVVHLLVRFDDQFYVKISLKRFAFVKTTDR